MSILMGLVANVINNEIIAQYPSKLNGDHLQVISDQVIPSLPVSTNQLRTLEHHTYRYHIKVYNDIAYICIAEPECRNRTCWAFLDSLFEAYNDLLNNNRLNQKFIKQQIKFFNDIKSEKISLLYDQIEELKVIQTRNIDTMIERGEKLHELLNASESISDTASMFHTATIKTLPWYVRLKIWIKKQFGKTQVKIPKLQTREREHYQVFNPEQQQQEEPEQQHMNNNNNEGDDIQFIEDDTNAPSIS